MRYIRIVIFFTLASCTNENSKTLPKKYQVVVDYIKKDRDVCELVANIRNVYPYGTGQLGVLSRLYLSHKKKSDITIPDSVDVQFIEALGNPYLNDTIVNELVPFFNVKGSLEQKIEMVSDSVRLINKTYGPEPEVELSGIFNSNSIVLADKISDKIVYAEFRVKKHDGFFPFSLCFFFFFDSNNQNQIVKVIEYNTSW